MEYSWKYCNEPDRNGQEAEISSTVVYCMPEFGQLEIDYNHTSELGRRSEKHLGDQRRCQKPEEEPVCKLSLGSGDAGHNWKFLKDKSGDTTSKRRQTRKQLGEEDGMRCRKMLLRDWLLKQAHEGQTPGLEWVDMEGEKLLRISWVHQSRSSWTQNDSHLFESWAKHTGKFWASPKDTKRWKANFRCAISSLPDIKEVRKKEHGFKLYRVLPEQPRKKGLKADQKRRSSVELNQTPTTPIAFSSSYPSASSLKMGIKNVTTAKKSEFSYLSVSAPAQSVFQFKRSSFSRSSSCSSSSFSSLLQGNDQSCVSLVSEDDSENQIPSSSSLHQAIIPLPVAEMNIDDDKEEDDDDEGTHVNQIKKEENEDDSDEDSDKTYDDDHDDDNDDNDDDDDDDKNYEPKRYRRILPEVKAVPSANRGTLDISPETETRYDLQMTQMIGSPTISSSQPLVPFAEILDPNALESLSIESLFQTDILPASFGDIYFPTAFF